MHRNVVTAFSLLGLAFAATAHADEYANSSQLAQTYISKGIQASASYGAGITIGVVDTGVFAAHNDLSGRVLDASTCVATDNCAGGFGDTFGHGTFVASIAAGARDGVGVLGAAPSANILAVKIALPNGTANYYDLVDGVTVAAQLGADIVNLSYGSFYKAPYAAYNMALVSALNTASALKTTTVIAGGNDGKTFLDNASQGGFSADALNHLVFVGSVNARNGKSSFSNTPGNSIFITNTGAKRSLASLWLMAPGENILGASYRGAGQYVRGSGTSFATPLVAGTLALLESRWPILKQTGMATEILFETAQDLGAAGTDAVYGRGLLRADRAFQPVGTLTIRNAANRDVAVSTITGGLLTSGAFGALPALTAGLSNLAAADKFGRDFYINLSSLITPAKRKSTLAAMLTHVSVNSGGARFADGSTLAFGQAGDQSHTAFTPSSAPVPGHNWFVNYTDASGTTLAGGNGFPAGASFAAALWNTDSAVGDDMALVDGSSALLNLAGGGDFAAMGRRLDPETRFAFGFSQTAMQDPLLAAPGNASDARAFGFGLSRQLTKAWTTGLTVGSLDETNSLLGSTYNSSAIGFGAHHSSISIGASSAYDLGGNRNFLVDASWLRTEGAAVSDGLITGVSAITARSAGAALAQRDAFTPGDRLAFSVRKPLTVASGSAALSTLNFDANGNASTVSRSIALSPDASETDLGVVYDAPIHQHTHWNAALSVRNDADNIRNATDATLMFGIKMAF